MAWWGSGPCLALGILQGLSLVALGIVTSRKCKGNSFFHGRRKERDFFMTAFERGRFTSRGRLA